MDNWIQKLDDTLQIIESERGTSDLKSFKTFLCVLMGELLSETEVSERGIVARFTSLLAAGNYVQVVEERQKYKIACLEEIALSKKWISKKNVINRIKFYGNCSYSKYLKKLLN